MSRFVIVCLAAFISVALAADVNTTGCSIEFNGQTASLEQFNSTNTTVGTEDYAISPCATKAFAGCHDMKGYIATYKHAGGTMACDAVYDNKEASFFDTETQTFSTTYTSSTGGLLTDVQKTIKMVVVCDPKAGANPAGTQKDNTITFKSATVCLEGVPNTPVPTTDAPPTPAPATPVPEQILKGCTVDLGADASASLAYFGTDTKLTVGASESWYMSLCEQTAFPGCNGTSYLTTNKSGACVDYTVKMDTIYFSGNKTFSTTFSTATTGLLGEVESVTVAVKCNTGAEGNVHGDRVGNTITFVSDTVCEGYSPVTPPPTPSPPVSTLGCTVQYGDQTATLENFDAVDFKRKVSGVEWMISPCAMQTFEGCNGTGYIAVNESNVCYVYNVKGLSEYVPALNTFTTSYSINNTQGLLLAGEPITMVVKCKIGAEGQEDGTRVGNTITFLDESVCPTTVTTAPAPEKKKGLSTGAIVGIVIGALAVLVIILVIFRWKSSKTEEEGEYQRV
jgi:hypothetical protein